MSIIICVQNACVCVCLKTHVYARNKMQQSKPNVTCKLKGE